MAKLHELIAVEDNLKGQATKVRSELTATFEKKRHLFEETRKTYTENAENSVSQVEEQKDIQTTVGKEIEWVSEHLAKAIDAGYQIDLANTEAKADVETEDEETLLKTIPAAALLRLQHRIGEIKELIQAIPTLDPAKGFQPDSDRGAGIYKARDVQKTRTQKQKKVITLAAATEKFPAQVQIIDVDVPVGRILEQEWSALLTPAIKAELLNRVEKLSRALAKARARANNTEIDARQNKIGKTLLNYIFEPLTKLG